MEIRKGGTLRKRFLSFLMAFALVCNPFVASTVDAYANQEVVAGNFETRIDPDALSASDQNTSQASFDMQYAGVEKEADSQSYTEEDLLRLGSLSNPASSEEWIEYIKEGNERVLSQEARTNGDTPLHHEEERSNAIARLVGGGAAFTDLAAYRNAKSFANTDDIASEDTMRPLTNVVEAISHDGDVHFVHVSEQLHLMATASNARYLGTDFTMPSELNHHALDLETGNDQSLMVYPNHTARLFMEHEFVGEDGAAKTAQGQLIIYSNVVFDLNDHSDRVIIDPQRLYPSWNLDGSDAGTDEITIRNMGVQRDGYTFLGWNSSPDGSGISFLDGEVLKAGPFSSDVVLYAIWERNEIRVRFFDALDADPEFAGKELASVSLTGNASVTPPAAPNHKTGYVFEAWNKSLDNVTDDMDVYAIYRPIQYTISYDKSSDDAIGEMRSTTQTYDSSFALSPSGFRREGFTLIGWQMQKDGTILNFAPEVVVTNLTQIDGEEIVLHAIWMKDKEAIRTDLHPKSADRLRVVKLITGNPAEDDLEFRFRLRAISSSATFLLPMPIAAQSKQVYDFSVRGGMARELDEIAFDTPGIYRYRLTELMGDDPDFEYDDSVVEILYTVVRQGGSLRAVRYILKDGMQISDVVFTNHYIGDNVADGSTYNALLMDANHDSKNMAHSLLQGQSEDGDPHLNGISNMTSDSLSGEAVAEEDAIPVSDSIGLRVYLDGEAPVEEAGFAFRIEGVGEALPMPDQNMIQKEGTGNAEFGEITFTAPGIYKYLITQEDFDLPGYTLDETVYEVVYLVSRHGDHLQFTKSIINKGRYADFVQFRNEYTLPRMKIVFNTNGSDEVIEDQLIPLGDYLVSPLPPKRLGYVFQGWLADNEPFDFAAPIKQNTTLVASWERVDHLVEFRDALDADVVYADALLQSSAVMHGGAATPPTEPNHKSGYHFLKWDRSIREVVQDEVIRAVYAPNTYYVDFDANSLGVNGLTLRKTFRYDAYDTLPMNGFTKQGDVFLGWSRSFDGEVEFSDRERVGNLATMDNQVVVLYAVWQSGERRTGVLADNANLENGMASDENVKKGFIPDVVLPIRNDLVQLTQIREDESKKQEMLPEQDMRDRQLTPHPQDSGFEYADDKNSQLSFIDRRSADATVLMKSPSVSFTGVETRISDAEVLSGDSAKRNESVIRYHIDENGKGVLTEDGVQTTIEAKAFENPNRITGWGVARANADGNPNSTQETADIQEDSEEAERQERTSTGREALDSKEVPKTSDGFGVEPFIYLGFGVMFLITYLYRKKEDAK